MAVETVLKTPIFAPGGVDFYVKTFRIGQFIGLACLLIFGILGSSTCPVGILFLSDLLLFRFPGRLQSGFRILNLNVREWHLGAPILEISGLPPLLPPGGVECNGPWWAGMVHR